MCTRTCCFGFLGFREYHDAKSDYLVCTLCAVDPMQRICTYVLYMHTNTGHLGPGTIDHIRPSDMRMYMPMCIHAHTIQMCVLHMNILWALRAPHPYTWMDPIILSCKHSKQQSCRSAIVMGLCAIRPSAPPLLPL